MLARSKRASKFSRALYFVFLSQDYNKFKIFVGHQSKL